MNPQYSVMIQRHRDDESEEIIVRYITADQAIDMLLAVADLPESEGEEETKEAEPEEEAATPPMRKRKVSAYRQIENDLSDAPSRGRRVSYDVDAVKADILNGMKNREVAEKHGLTPSTIGNLKDRMKKSGELNSRGLATKDQRLKEMANVLTPELRDQIQDLRETGKTTTQIAGLLGLEFEDVAKVMSRGAINSTPPPVKARSTIDADWYKQEILDMVNDGMSDEEIYKSVYNRITHAQYRSALEWAKEQVENV